MTLSNSLDIADSGLSTQSMIMKVHANNIANINTPNYVRKIPVLSENATVSFDDVISGLRNGVINTGISYGPGGVTMAGIMNDPTPGRKVYQPGNPQADKDGYITTSNVSILSDMADATSTSRLYEANLAVISLVKAMQTRALDIGRNS